MILAVALGASAPALALADGDGHWSQDGLGKWVTAQRYQNAVTYYDSAGRVMDTAQGLQADSDGVAAFSMVVTLEPNHPSLNHAIKINGSAAEVSAEPVVEEWYEEESYGRYQYCEAKIRWTVKAEGLPAGSWCAVSVNVTSNFGTYVKDEWGKTAPAPGAGGSDEPASSEDAEAPDSGGDQASAADGKDSAETSKGDSAASSGNASSSKSDRSTMGNESASGKDAGSAAGSAGSATGGSAADSGVRPDELEARADADDSPDDSTGYPPEEAALTTAAPSSMEGVAVYRVNGPLNGSRQDAGAMTSSASREDRSLPAKIAMAIASLLAFFGGMAYRLLRWKSQGGTLRGDPRQIFADSRRESAVVRGF